MATIMIDYENVWQAYGLKGVEYLTREDTLYIFYSKCCSKIRAEYMEAIEKSNCDFRIYRLQNISKNALDFYIASQVGECFGGTTETQIAIISNDRGFDAVADFWELKSTDQKQCKVVVAPTIEKGLLTLNASEDKERRRALNQKAQMLDMEERYEIYMRRNTALMII